MPKALTLPNHRRRHVTLLALCVAAQVIDKTERTRRPLSDQDDMKLFLDELISSNGEMEMFVRTAHSIVEGIKLSE